jgi:hypothetical protein
MDDTSHNKEHAATPGIPYPAISELVNPENAITW